MRKAIVTVAFFVTCILPAIIGCASNKKEETKDVGFSRYLFLSDNGVLHKDEHCIWLRSAKDDNGHRVYGKSFIDTLDIISDQYMTYCTHCVNSEDYTHIQRMIRRNSYRR